MVNVVSESKQEFCGETYWKCGKYFQRYGKRLHRAVYEFYHGQIPENHSVHHADGDRSNNQIENLVLMRTSEHTRGHMREPERKAHASRAIKLAQDKAKEWHGSEDGRVWHREHYQRFKDQLHAKIQIVCAQCGKTFEAEDVGTNKFCGKNCKAAFRRASGVDNETRACATCGGLFEANRYARVKYCSDECRAKSPWGQSRKGNVSGQGRRVLPDRS